MGLVFWSMGAISPRLYTVPFQQEPALGQWSLVILGTTVTSSAMPDAHGEVTCTTRQKLMRLFKREGMCLPV